MKQLLYSALKLPNTVKHDVRVQEILHYAGGRRRKGRKHLELHFSSSRPSHCSITSGDSMFYNTTCALRRKLGKNKVAFTSTPLVSCSISHTLLDWAPGNRKKTILFKTKAEQMQTGARDLHRVGMKHSNHSRQALDPRVSILSREASGNLLSLC